MKRLLTQIVPLHLGISFLNFFVLVVLVLVRMVNNNENWTYLQFYTYLWWFILALTTLQIIMIFFICIRNVVRQKYLSAFKAFCFFALLIFYAYGQSIFFFISVATVPSPADHKINHSNNTTN